MSLLPLAIFNLESKFTTVTTSARGVLEGVLAMGLRVRLICMMTVFLKVENLEDLIPFFIFRF